jgi:crotonobetainyl-CoA:carnitine CoA-transferase CaiB-like acyl-CoA transferase
VYCSVEGLGPYRVPGDDRGVVDLVAQALSGVMAATGHPGGPPTRSAAPIADTAAGLYGAVAVLAGLLERDGRHGKATGSGFRVSMLGGLVSLLWDEHLDVLHRSGAPERAGNTIARTCPFNTFLTADDEWVAICAFSPAEWHRVLRATELTQLERPEFDEQVARIRHRELIEGEIARWARARPRAQVLERLSRAGASFAPVTTVADVLADEHYQRTLLYEVRHPVHGRTGALGSAFPIIVDELQVHPAPAPGLGQHTDAILRDLAHMTDAEIAELRASGAAR